jgi:hypothetical protein
MTERRYFYTDPLAAAWMELHHDVKTGNLDDPFFSAWQVTFFEADWRRSGEQPPEYRQRYYIHPDSLHLLEPRIGDLIHNGCCALYYMVIDEWISGFSGNAEVEVERAVDWFSGEHYGLIIQRGGKPFMWPESEVSCPHR